MRCGMGRGECGDYVNMPEADFVYLACYASRPTPDLTMVATHIQRTDGAIRSGPDSSYSVDYDGVPVPDTEEEVDDPTAITDPFDPERIKITTRQPVVELLKNRFDHKELDLNPDFQRHIGIWDDTRKSRLVESLLLRIPIPVFYMAEDPTETAIDRLIVVDGVQRLSTIFAFMNDTFALKRLEYLRRFDGATFSQLPGHMQRRIRETELICNIIERETPEEVMYNVFLRVNTGGRALNSQEIRHAMNPGPARELLASLAASDEFLEATQRSIRTIRMDDRELVLRFLSFRLSDWRLYQNRSFDNHLALTMKRINNATDLERKGYSSDFVRSMKAASDILGRDAFRRPRDETLRKKPINKALFEAWSTQFAGRSADELEKLRSLRPSVTLAFRTLIGSDGDFNNAISYATASVESIKKRHGAIEQLLDRIIES